MTKPFALVRLSRANPMAPTVPTLRRPNPFLAGRSRRKPGLPALGKYTGPLAGAALATASDLALDAVVPRGWQIPVHLGIGLVSAGLARGPLAAAFAGAHLYAGLVKTLARVSGDNILLAAAAASA